MSGYNLGYYVIKIYNKKLENKFQVKEYPYKEDKIKKLELK